MNPGETDLLVLEYQEINAHLRTNTTGFVNWFSAFLTFSLVAAVAFLVTGEHRQGLRGLALWYGVPIACLLLHVIALAGILIFRHYVTAAHRKLDEIVKLLGDTGCSVQMQEIRKAISSGRIWNIFFLQAGSRAAIAREDALHSRRQLLPSAFRTPVPAVERDRPGFRVRTPRLLDGCAWRA